MSSFLSNGGIDFAGIVFSNLRRFAKKDNIIKV